ncbi:MAG: dihydroorotate dehydrogenase electron transfer subunit [Solirubrobacteraceae bacterium]|nr:dihydroorotate dehydrogenase electron transfer subunit [Solirubrobacteraceae bacterium]MEA2334024.1 dihydroorotate dehydrogenase electron transfer subunit [Solirubrobacteraceae bacterium]
MSQWSAAPAPFHRRLLTVLGIDELGAYRVLRVADVETPEPRPGQFAMIAAAERWGGGEDERPYLPRAFSIARRRVGESHFLLEDVGPGTRRLCELREGDGMWALGPLGKGFAPPRPRHRAILVGGGVGIAPLAILQDALEAEAATDVTVLLGFRDGARAQGAALLHGAQVATDDGSVGHHGLLTELLSKELYEDSRAEVYACGPAPMLEAVRAMCATRDVPAQLALEAGMACGFGACYGCAVPKRGGGYLRVCVDGPVVDAAELDRVSEHAGAPS